jgi:hypothetical protein
MNRWLIAVAIAASSVWAQACGKKCAGEGDGCDGGLCLISAVACDAGQPVCTKIAIAADGTPCWSGSCVSGSCTLPRSCWTGAPCTPLGHSCRVGSKLCSAGGTIGCEENTQALDDGQPCGDGGATCSAGFCQCNADGGSPGCPQSMACDTLAGGSSVCREPCVQGGGCGKASGYGTGVSAAVCAPEFDGGTYVDSRCAFGSDGGTVGAPCAATLGCRADYTCIATADGGSCAQYCSLAPGAPACANGHNCVQISSTLGYCSL